MTEGTLRKWALPFLLALPLMLVPVAALAQPYPPGAAVTCNKSAVAPGDFVECSADGFAPGTEVQVIVGGQVVDTVTADEDGVAHARIRIPPGTPDGPIEIRFEGLDASGGFVRVAVATLTVSAALPVTGAQGVDRWVALAVAAVVIGAALLVATRRRRATTGTR